MPADSGTAAIDETPGTSSNGTPARTSASASSPPRPKTNGSPPFSRTTRRPRLPCATSSALMSSWLRPSREMRSAPIGASRRSRRATSRSYTSTSHVRTRDRPRTVISSGSPGPRRRASTRHPQSCLRDALAEVRRAAPRRCAGSASPTAARAAARRASCSCSKPICAANRSRSHCASAGDAAAGRDGDRDRPAPVDRREDERAELGHVDDVAEDAPLVRVREDAAVQRVVARRRDDEPRRRPAAQRRKSSGDDSGVTTAPQPSRPSTFSRAIAPAPTTRHARPVRSRQAT